MERDTQKHRHVKTTRKVMYSFNVERLVADYGGVRPLARVAGVKRQTVYRWLRQGHVSTNVLELLLSIDPFLQVRTYFDKID